MHILIGIWIILRVKQYKVQESLVPWIFHGECFKNSPNLISLNKITPLGGEQVNDVAAVNCFDKSLDSGLAIAPYKGGVNCRLGRGMIVLVFTRVCTKNDSI